MSTVSTEISKYIGSATKLADIWGTIIFNVKASPYNAKGDGITDDTVAINAAIAAAMANGGGDVFFPPGTYIVSSQLTTIMQSVYLVGCGPRASIIKHTSNTGNLIRIGSVAAGLNAVVKGAGIRDLSIWHNTTRTDGITVWAENAQQVKIKNIEFTNAYVFAQLGSATDINSIFTVFDDVIGNTVGEGKAIDVRGGTHGIHLLTVQINNEAQGTFLSISAPLDTLFMDNCLIQRFRYGMIINHSSGAVQNAFINNVVWDTTETNTLVFQPSGTGVITRFRFVNCWFSSVTGVGILLDCPSTAIIDGIYFTACRWVFVGASGVLINTQYVINVSLDDCVLSNCSRLGNNLYPAVSVVANGKKFKITNCKIGAEGATQTFQSYGITLGANCDLYTIANNDLIGNITGAISDAGGTFTKKLVKDNLGYNPTGLLTAPAVPASGVAQANNFSFPVQIIIGGGTVTGIQKNGTSINGMTSGTLTLAPGETVTIGYTVVPFWTWFGM